VRRKGIILAGGSSTRLFPITQATVKQLLPVYDKPLVYYPLSVLMLAGICDILIITTPRDASAFEALLGDGSRFGVNLTYAVQPRPEGLAQAFVIGRDFVGDDPSCLILGDNIFHGPGLEAQLVSSAAAAAGATIFTHHVRDPDRYGVVEFNDAGAPMRLHEKPKRFVSNYAITGLYFYDNAVLDIAASIKPSARGELEITDVNQAYLDRGALACVQLGRGFAWLDAGTPDSLLEAAQFVQTIERRQGLRIACLEEIAVHKGFIPASALAALAAPMAGSDYGQYLLKVAAEHGAG
jgi:glucose-1-phosphate thymidylyltransferase